MSQIELESKTAAARLRLEALEQRLGTLPAAQKALLDEVLEELHTSLEELQVAVEELMERNEALAAAQYTIVAERQRYMDLFELAPDGYIVTSREGIIEEVNRAAADLFQRDQAFLRGKPLPLLVEEKEVRTFRRLLLHLQGGEGIWGWETEMRRGEDRFPALLDVTPLREDGRLVGLRWLIRDITERKRAEEALNRWAQIFEHAQWGVAVASADGRLLETMNPAFAKMHGYTVAEMTGKPVTEVYAPECRSKVLEHMGRTQESGHFSQESCHIRKDGSTFPVLTDITAIKDSSGQVLYRAVNVQDITELKRAEEALQRTNQELELRVQERTADLTAVNAKLSAEVEQRSRAQQALRARVREQQAVARLGLRALRGIGLDALMNETVRLVADTLQVKYAKVLQLLPDAEGLLLVAGVGWKPSIIGRAVIPAHTRSHAGYTLMRNEPVVMESIDAETRFQPSRLLREHGVVSGVTVVIHGRERPFGVLCVHTPEPRKFMQEEAHFLQSVANVMGAVMDRARGDAALKQIEWLLRESATARPVPSPALSPVLSDKEQAAVSDLSRLNRSRVLLEAAGREVLGEMADGYLELLGTSVAIHEKNGDYALNKSTSGWCRFLDQASRKLCGTDDDAAAMASGRWHCHESCWNGASRVAIEGRAPADIECRGGIRIYALPVMAGQEVVGAINFGYGNPARDPDKLAAIARRYGVSVEELREQAAGYESRPPFIVEIAKARLASSAKLLGTLVERSRFEERLLDTIAEREEAQAGQEKFVLLVENSGDFIGMAGLDGNMLFINPAGRAMAGLDGPEQVDTTRLSDLWTEDTWAKVRDTVLPALSSGSLSGAQSGFGRWRGEGRLRRRGSELVTDVEINLFLVRHLFTREPICLAVIQHDISERKKIERMKNEFVSTVSHELRTPLTSICGSLGLMAGGVAGELPTQAKGLIDIAHRNSTRLVRLINDILDIDKIESGRLAFNLRAVDLMPVVEEAIASNRSYAASFAVDLALVAAVPGAQAWTDPDRLMQVLTNLLSNAAKFSPRHGTASVSVTCRQDKLRIAVTDCGPGIPPEFRPQMFQKFAQADASDSRQKGGTGLGLSIAKAIVDRLGGEIGFDTEIGRGTTFYVDLPEWRGGRAEG